MGSLAIFQVLAALASICDGFSVSEAKCWLPPVHNVQFVKYDVTVSFMAQVLDTVAYFVSHVLVVDTVTYFDIFR